MEKSAVGTVPGKQLFALARTELCCVCQTPRWEETPKMMRDEGDKEKSDSFLVLIMSKGFTIYI